MKDADDAKKNMLINPKIRKYMTFLGVLDGLSSSSSSEESSESEDSSELLFSGAFETAGVVEGC